MKKIIIFLIFFGSLFFASNAVIGETFDFSAIRESSEIEKNWRLYLISRAALVEVIVQKRDARPNYHLGSAFPVFVDRQENETYIYFLTNVHVVDEDELRVFDETTIVIVKFPLGGFKAEIIPQKIGWEIESLILKVKAPNDFDAFYFEVSDYPGFMETVWVVGFPYGSPVVNKGYAAVFQTAEKEEVPYFYEIVSDGLSGPGMSGSMVVTSSGKIVGIVYAIDTGKEHIIYAVPGMLIRQFLIKNIPNFLFFEGGP